MPQTGEITKLIEDWQSGDPLAENALFEALYDKLHKLALQCLRNEAKARTLGPTALVHEAYLRFRRAGRLEIANSQHFLHLVARVMRRILVDRARARLSEKRGRDWDRAEFGEGLQCSTADAEQIIAVDRALEQLSRQSERQAHLVELRYFAGFNEDEAAEAMGISTRTVRREWQVARTRLQLAIDGIPRVSS